MKKVLLLTLFFCIWQTGFAQDDLRVVEGTVTSEGVPVPGVNVVLKGTNQGTVTDVEGNFQLKVPQDGGVLVFSFIGYATKEVNIGRQSNIQVSLSSDVTELNEIVIAGYRPVKESNLTSAITTVGGEEIQQQPIGSIDNLLQGRSPGVLITNQNGRPGGNAYIRVRGVGSVNASNSPLFIIDGIQVTQADYNSLNPNDVETISVLKDAASTAIYGARASNGVVLITTKSGAKAAEPRFEYKFQYGRKEYIPFNFDMMNKEQKIAYELELGWIDAAEAESLRQDQSAPETDWFDVLMDPGVVSSHNFSIANNTDKVNYYISVGTYDEDGISVGSAFERLSGRINMTVKTNDWLTLGNQLFVSRTKDNELRDRYNVQNPFFAVFAYNPYEPEFVLDDEGNFILDEDGEKIYNLTRQGFSISEAVRNNPENIEQTNIIGSVFADIKPFENLLFNSKLGVNYQVYRNEFYIKPGSILDGYIGDPNAPGTKTDSGSGRSILTWTNTASYDFKVANDHNLNILGGTEFIQYDIKGWSVSAKGFPSEEFITLDNAAEVTGGDTDRSQWSLWSQFAQLSYDFNEKYLFTASIRRDGSSRFGEDRKFGTFWALSAGWNITEENFFNSDKLSQLKLRGSVGTSGNVPDEFYASVGLYGFGSYNNLTAAFPTQLANPNLQWESNFNYNIGLDFGLLNNRFSGSIDYYNRRTFDLLFPKPLSETTGFSSRLENVGEIVNYGVEVQLMGKVITKNDFTFDLFGSFTRNYNEVTELGGTNEIINEYSGLSILREGLAANTFYLVRYAGVNPVNGEPLFLTKDGEVTNSYSADDAVALEGKTPLAKYFGNFGFNLNYKGIGLSTQFYYQGGNYTYNIAYNQLLLSDGEGVTRNQRVDAFNYWRKPGDTGVLPKPSLGNAIDDSNRYLERADFIRLRNVQLSYTLPVKVTERIKVQNLTFYVQGTNLWTYNPYFSGDPEVGIGGAESDLTLLGEATLYSYFNTRGYTAGINLTF